MAGADVPIVITGPTGWIGTALLATIAAQRGRDWHRTVRLFGSSGRAIEAPDGSRLDMKPLDTLAPADVDGAIVVHLAYLTKEKVDLVGPRRFLDTNMEIDDFVLGALAGARAKGVFVASSGAAALAAEGTDRHLYGMAKLIQEDRFLQVARDAGTTVLAGRIFNIAGPHINKVSSYAIGSFLTQALDEGRIQINARVPVYRSYLSVEDLCALILRLLDLGIGSETPVDLCGAEVVEMQDIARLVARVIGLDQGAIVRPPVDYDRPSIYLGRPTDTCTLAQRARFPLRSFADQVVDTANFLRTVNSSR